MKKSVFIVGSKGIPAKYGGFETFVEQLTKQQSDKDIQYYVACMNYDKDFFQHNGANCFNIHVPNIGPGKAIYYDIAALKWTIKYIKENHIESPVVYILACRIGPFVKKYVKAIHQLGGLVYLNPDGHEWLRAKWNKLIRQYWKYSEKLMIKNSDYIICDSRHIEQYVHDSYHQYSPKTTFIAYGADEAYKATDSGKRAYAEWLKKTGATDKGYYLIVGRFVPENNYFTMIKEFMKTKTRKDLVIVSNVEKNRFYQQLIEQTHFDEDSRIKFVGTVYNQELLKEIRLNAFAYLHGHEVGGTNPSLIEALSLTTVNLLLDVGFNHEVGEDGALYWNKESGSLSRLIEEVDNFSEVRSEKLSQLAKERIASGYSWNQIINDYETAFLLPKDEVLS